MFISFFGRFILYHYPKTAGTHLQYIFQDFGVGSDDDIWGGNINGAYRAVYIPLYDRRGKKVGEGNVPKPLKHAPVGNSYEQSVIHASQDFGVEKWYKFGVVRNPWDLCVSHLNFQNITGDRSFTKKDIMSFEDREGYVGTFTKFFDLDNDKIDYLIRTESFESNLDILIEKLKLHAPQYTDKDWGVLDKLRKTKDSLYTNKTNHKHYSYYYDDESREYIGKLFEQDIKRFNYKFENIREKENGKILL